MGAKQLPLATKKKLFLAALRTHGTVAKAAEILDMDRCTPYEWRRKDSKFAAKWQQYLDDLLEDIEIAAHTKHAVNDPHFCKWILSVRKPKKYAKEQSGGQSGPIRIEIVERDDES